MKERSSLWCIFHHPLKILIRTVIYWLIIFLILTIVFGDYAMILTQSNTAFTVGIFISFLLALSNVRKKANRELRMSQLYQSRPVYTTAAPPPKKRKRKSLLFGALGAMNRSVDNSINGFANGLASGIMGTNSRSQQEEQARRMAEQQRANQAAWDRWHAKDMQKKAEWDARDAALRGKDIAAWQRKNDADYWRNQSMR